MVEKEADSYFSAVKNSRGQVTIFIIVGIILAVAIGLFFIFNSTNIIQIGFRGGTSTNAAFQGCIEGKISDAVSKISERGSLKEDIPSIRFRFEGEEFSNITYLCYTQSSYVPCTNQIGLIVPEIESEIKEFVSNSVADCFNTMISSIERQGFETDSRYSGFEVKISKNFVSVKTDSKITLTKNDETTNQENIGADFKSDLRGLLLIAQEIVNQESTFCNFDTHGFSVLYPKYDVRETNIDLLKGSIYSIESVDTNEVFRFATRGCIFPVA